MKTKLAIVLIVSLCSILPLLTHGISASSLNSFNYRSAKSTIPFSAYADSAPRVYECPTLKKTYERRLTQEAIMTMDIEQTGCDIKGSAIGDKHQNLIKGTWDPNKNGFYVTCVRTQQDESKKGRPKEEDPFGCTTTLEGYLYLQGGLGNIRLNWTGTDAKCNLAANWSEDTIWTPR